MGKKVSRREFIKEGGKFAGGIYFFSNFHYLGMGYDRVFDILIINGTVVDGIGDEAYKADVAIEKEKIVALGGLKGAKTKTIIDARGKIVSPGFIDIHSHSDLEHLVNPPAHSKVRQGITTELVGNCGSSIFPRKPLTDEEKRRMEQRFGFAVEVTDLAQYRRSLREQGISVNNGTLIGQGTLREYVMDMRADAPTEKELSLMKEEVEGAMRQGAFGISTGLEYTPSGFAGTEELMALAESAARYGGIYATHIRSEEKRLIEAIKEAITISHRSGASLEISHLKAVGEENYWKLNKVLDIIHLAARQGIAVNADRYPYTAYSTGLSINFPLWAFEGGEEEFVGRLKDKGIRKKMRKETEARVKTNNGWTSMMIIDVRNEENKYLIGKRLGEVACEKGIDPYEFACDLLISEEGDVGIVGFGMSEENTEKVLADPLVMLCTDGSAIATSGPLSEGMPHPRNFGAFPRFLRLYVREKKLLSLPAAIRKMTAMPAAKLDLIDRGIIQKGNYGDIVIFDLDKLDDRATYTDPKRYPTGIDYVIVNGKIVIDKGEHTGARPGKVLNGPAIMK
jgi:N-acyl-D-amino-acid deacylase